MKKFYKRLLNKKGLTLVEILVVLIVTSILLACAMGMLAPVNNLLNSVKGNAHMDAACDTINEYLRGTLEKAEKVAVISYNDSNTIRNTWKTYTDTYPASEGYKVKAMGVLENYNGDFRFYDFGDVTVIDYSWGYNPADPMETKTANDGIVPGNALVSLVKNRDGGGRWQKGWDGHEFHWFDAFNEEFYSNGSSGNVNYSYQIAVELNGGSNSYLTISSQVFKRTGTNVHSGYADPVHYFSELATYEPVNQIREMSFRLLNGTASFDGATSLNTVATVDGVKCIQLAPDPNAVLDSDHSVQKRSQEGLVILYVVRDIDAYYTMTTAAAP